MCNSCSFLRFLLRAFLHFIYLSPKPALLPTFPYNNRPYIAALLGANLLCILFHILYPPPVAGEATRGYLHGGLVMDFIGQKAESGRLAVLGLDVVVVGLQVVQMCVRERREGLLRGGGKALVVQGLTAPPTSQALDSEERGVRRSEEHASIEMQTLDPSGAATASSAPTTEGAESTESRVDTSEHSTLLSAAPRATDATIFDAFNSGQIILGDFNIPRTVKQQFLAYRDTPAEAPQLNREVRANITGQLLRWRFGANLGGPAARMG